MNSVCISNDAHILNNRPTYVNLHRWPESDAEFIKSAAAASNVHKGVQIRSDQYSLTCAPRVVDSISCRQMYLRSYKFSKKKETLQEKISKKCFGKVKKEKVVVVNRKRRSSKVCGKRCTVMMSRVKEISCAALYSIFRKLLFCSATVDVADHSEMKIERGGCVNEISNSTIELEAWKRRIRACDHLGYS